MSYASIAFIVLAFGVGLFVRSVVSIELLRAEQVRFTALSPSPTDRAA